LFHSCTEYVNHSDTARGIFAAIKARQLNGEAGELSKENEQ